jgi:hypothetical protein
VQVAVPQRRTQLLAVELPAELSPILGVGEQLVALELIAQVQRGRPGAELLEDRQIDSVGIQFERDRKVLKPDACPEHGVEQSRSRAQHTHRERVRLRVSRHQQAHPHAAPASEDPATGQEEQQCRHRVVDVGGALEQAAALAQYLDQPAPLPPRRECRWQRP